MNKARVVLITGSSRGIGAATAVYFARHGYDVCINYKTDLVKAEQVADKIRRFGVRAELVKADVSQESDVSALFSRIDEVFGRLDVLVNNAGVLKPQMPLLNMDAERINQLLTTNITSAFICSREAIKRMLSGSSIVNVSSVAAKTGSPNEYIDYAATKGAIDTLTMGLAKEVGCKGIRVNCVRPGLIYTDMHTDGGEEGRVERLKSNLPLRRGGQPEEVAAAIYFLASDSASFTTGAFIDVAGGL
ncbi:MULTISPECIES: SDR family oxidoreductase [unclassified Pseudoalteromonas]|uniref:SDR family oxidoreductase n=1 Tax=unclassified Pseudoalteromonas TaxID=194690 RepID=UPI0011098142|nr:MULTISPECIES: SDR family oxidoreductase [unclassified Pseudoalteromonas]TMN85725.1 NAD(P)-dependent oxidoreductase [Pseudoalteromonas sp. S410]TMN93052.1 NAD(P)-dependent oxidoreductase [Pseudoalteromonas sp. S408]TMN99544.1 NAD(P)-dependent oxidoreductase [Pseudoalteromonas sp. S407]TMO00320.1 NAD(P)-dependent oxidoreductase [Pseudoalteromonas sp. S409]TMO12746.1 NAD(P)-dependent oxidoreductase [Pseudoalteromonas sp. S186]